MPKVTTVLTKFTRLGFGGFICKLSVRRTWWMFSWDLEVFVCRNLDLSIPEEFDFVWSSEYREPVKGKKLRADLTHKMHCTWFLVDGRPVCGSIE